MTLSIRLQAVPFWLVERVRSQHSETGASGNKREETEEPLPKLPSAQSLLFFRAQLFRATSQLSRKGLLAVLTFNGEISDISLKDCIRTGKGDKSVSYTLPAPVGS